MNKSKKGRQLNAAGQVSAANFENELTRISALDLDHLRREWNVKFNAAPPCVRSRDTLLRLFAWRIQTAAFGGLDAETERKLRQIAKAVECNGDYQPKASRHAAPGVVLTREWKGVIHKVTVTGGGFQHLGKQYGSLSDIARTITGTRWSGPRFFGLEQKEQPKLQRPAAVAAPATGDAL